MTRRLDPTGDAGAAEGAEVRLDAPATEPVALEGAEVVQASFELAGVRGAELLPPGLAPTIPTLCTFLVVRAAASPLGPFTFAQARLSCRSGVRARALVVATAVDGPAELGARWGIGGDAGGIRLDRRYDRIDIGVAAWHLAIELHDPAPISAADLQYVTGLHPVRWGGEERLAQVELDVHAERAERARPVLASYDGFGPAGVVPRHPVVATMAVGTLTLPRIRFLLRPEVPPSVGTERITA
jgi:hypothetical protein